MNKSGEAVRGLVKSRVEFPPAQIRGFFLIMRSTANANLGLADVNRYLSSFPGVKVCIHTQIYKMANANKCIEEALDYLNIRKENRKIILKEEQKRAV